MDNLFWFNLASTALLAWVGFVPSMYRLRSKKGIKATIQRFISKYKTIFTVILGMFIVFINKIESDALKNQELNEEQITRNAQKEAKNEVTNILLKHGWKLDTANNLIKVLKDRPPIQVVPVKPVLEFALLLDSVRANTHYFNVEVQSKDASSKIYLDILLGKAGQDTVIKYTQRFKNAFQGFELATGGKVSQNFRYITTGEEFVFFNIFGHLITQDGKKIPVNDYLTFEAKDKRLGRLKSYYFNRVDTVFKRYR